MKKYLCCALMAAALLAGNAHAITEETDDNNQSSMVIYGQTKRNEIFSLDNYAEKKGTSSAYVDIFKREDIVKQNIPSFADLLNQLGSVTVQNSNGSDGSPTSVRMRGTDRVRLTVDGIRVDRPSMTSPGVEAQFLLLDDIETVEVIRGPQGNVAGTNASGGLIAMQTRRGRGPLKLEMGSDFGTYGTFKERIAIMGGNDDADFYLATTWYKTDGGMRTKNLGRINNDDYNNLNITTNLGKRLLDGKADLRNIFRFSRARKDVGIGYDYDYTTYTTTLHQDPNNYGLNYDISEVLSFTHQPTDKYNYDVRFGLYHNESNNYLLADNLNSDPLSESISKISSTRLNFITQHNVKLADWNTFSAGYNLETEFINGKLKDTSFWSVDSDKYSGNTIQNDVFLNDVINIKDILFIRGGARLSHNSDFGTYVSPNASGALVLPTFKIKGAKTKFRGSWGQSRNNPTLYQRFGTMYGYLIPNRDLHPEKMNSWDVGITQSFFDEKLSFDFGYFNSRYKDYIGYDYISFPGKYINIDRAKIDGYEAKATWEPNDKFKLVLNYTYTNAKDSTTGYDLPATPKNRLNGMIYLTPFERWSLYFGLETASSRTYGSSAERVKGYVDARIGTSIRLFTYKDASVYLRANIYNLFNQNITMYREYGQCYYAPKIRFMGGLFVEYNLPTKNKEKV